MTTTELGWCLGSVEGVLHAVELGKGIPLEEQLDDPPEGRRVSDVVVHSLRHARVQDSEAGSIAGEDERSGIAFGRKVSSALAIIDNDLAGLESELGTSIGVHAGIVAQRKLGGVAILGDDIEGLSVLVFRIGIGDEAARQSAMDRELEVGWDGFVLANGIDGPKTILELADVVLVT